MTSIRAANKTQMDDRNLEKKNLHKTIITDLIHAQSIITENKAINSLDSRSYKEGAAAKRVSGYTGFTWN